MEFIYNLNKKIFGLVFTFYTPSVIRPQYSLIDHMHRDLPISISIGSNLEKLALLHTIILLMIKYRRGYFFN